MGNPFRPHTRQSRSPSRPSVVRRASTSSSSQQHHQRQHHHYQQNDPTLSRHDNEHRQTYRDQSPATTPGSSERSTKRIKLTVRKPTVASPGTRRGQVQSAKKEDDSSSNHLPRPPTRLTLVKPHGELLRTTNGVQTTLKFTRDVLPAHASRSSTAEPPQREARKTGDRRSLRSHDEGPRLKSELAVYFPDYEEVIYDSPKEAETLTVDSVLVITDGPDVSATKAKSKGKANPGEKDNIQVGRRVTSPRGPAPTSVTVPPRSHDRNKFNGAQMVDFSTIEKSVGHHPRDPLTDSFYFKSHRRAERKEKQLRNIEKERAMHEKAQLERLLDGLESHDWLRVMGIIGVTDSEAKKFESKRNYFIGEVKALLLKFKTWKEEERRLKLAKEAALAAEEDEDEDDEDDEEEEEEEEEDERTEDEDDAVASAGEEPESGKPELSSSDFDNAAARQLQMEASGGAKGKGGKGGKGKTRERVPPQLPPPSPPVIYRPPTPDGPFTSFYSKPHLRSAALGKARHGRNVTAFGQAIPEPEEQEFVLPGDYITPESIKESARRRRRMKRESFIDKQ